MRGILAGALIAGHLSSGASCPPLANPALACQCEAAAAELRWGLPAHLLLAIGQVESGRQDPETGRVLPWPWSIHAEDADYVLRTPAEAATVAGVFQSHGIASIDVGCFQVNLHYHPSAFASLAQAFDPHANADYAARFLRALFDRSGDWGWAVAAYHSADPLLGAPYRARVIRAWQQDDGASEPPAGAGAATTTSDGDAHVILMDAAAAAIPVYSARTAPPGLRIALGLPPRP